jgi:predicted AlkP superfamily pyrophosphatase or phosphodiesterase
MRTLRAFVAGTVLAVAALLGTPSADATTVVLISIDGLRPGDLFEADQRGLKIPALRRLLASGAYASAVKGVLPTLTYPSHTTILTGVSPAKHGIVSNLTFDPTNKNQQGWYWYASDIQVPTLWDAAHAAGLKTANVHWPVSANAKIDDNLAQIWRTGTADDRKLLRALSTPGLQDGLERDLGVAYPDGIDESVEGDERRGVFAVRVLEKIKPDFATFYFTGLDHVQHQAGPGTPEAHDALERIDAVVGKVIAAARKLDPDTVIAVISDHGFASVATDVNLIGAFLKAGLIEINPKGEVVRWQAEPWFSGGSAAIVLADPNDGQVAARVRALLGALKNDPQNGIATVLEAPAIKAAGGAPEASFYVDFKLGYEMGTDPTAPLVQPSKLKGMHGYFPTSPEMAASFVIDGAGLSRAGSLGEIDMRDIAPTLAAILGAQLPQAEGRVLLGVKAQR